MVIANVLINHWLMSGFGVRFFLDVPEVLLSAAMVFAPGGTGTEWEIFQTIEQIKSGQLTPVPIYVVGDRKIHWKSLYDRLEDMMLRGTINREEVESLMTHIDNPEDVFELMSKDLGL